MRQRKAISFRQKDVCRPPQDQPWCWKSLEMLQSPAFRKMATPTRDFIEFLEVQNMDSAGQDNGQLLATYRQLEDWGINAARIRPAIDDALKRGLVEETPGGYRGHARNWPSRYRLTYYGTKRQTEIGWEWVQPTDDWKRYKPAKNILIALETKAKCLRN